MLSRSERHLVSRAYRYPRTSPVLGLSAASGTQVRGLVLGSINRGTFSTDDIVKLVATNYVNGLNGWRRYASTETRTPDPKPFPLPPHSKQQQQPPPVSTQPPIPPPPPSSEPPKKTDSGKSVTAASATPTDSITASKTLEAADTETSTSIDKPKEKQKLTIWQKVKKEIIHYWDGTKLLGKEIRISFRLALKMAAGYELSRRESRQLKRTTQDLIRLVPFSVFVIVPFAELLLPVALKLFPNMLPSTYEGESAKEAKRLALSKTRKDVSNFLRTTIQESGLYISKATKQSDEFAEFFNKVRTKGECPSDEDVIAISKIFRDDLTLDNLSRAQLIAMSRYMGLNTFGTDALLRYQLRHHLRQIKRDDKAISFEGVNSLSVPELQYATAARGIRTVGQSPAKLRDDLQQWLDLRLKHGIPSTLLVLSNAYAYGQEDKPNSAIENLRTTLSCLTDELFHEAELEVHNAEGAATNKQRLEVLEEQEELIEDENKQEASAAKDTGTETKVKDHEDLDEREEARQAEAASDNAEEADVPAEQLQPEEQHTLEAEGADKEQVQEQKEAERDEEAEVKKEEQEESEKKDTIKN